MAAEPTFVGLAPPVQLGARLSPVARVRRLARRQPLGMISFTILAIITVMALFAPLITQGTDPNIMIPAERLQPPGSGHLLGSDELGRDLFTRIVYGARISLAVGFIAVMIGTVIGATSGVISAVAGRWVDMLIQRVVDAMLAFPTIILALAIVSVLGKGIVQVTIAIGVVTIPRYVRVARASTLGVMPQTYIDAAVSTGATFPRLMVRHILPNILAPLMVLSTAGFASAILSEASLSFLGVGTPPPTPSWGAMLSGGVGAYLRSAPHVAIFPGIAISLAVFSFNLFGDMLRDVLDPRLRGS